MILVELPPKPHVLLDAAPRLGADLDVVVEALKRAKEVVKALFFVELRVYLVVLLHDEIDVLHNCCGQSHADQEHKHAHKPFNVRLRREIAESYR